MNNSTTKQKKLLICGDSFLAPTKSVDDNKGIVPEWAWWSRLAEDLNCEVINQSISGFIISSAFRVLTIKVLNKINSLSDLNKEKHHVVCVRHHDILHCIL